MGLIKYRTFVPGSLPLALQT